MRPDGADPSAIGREINFGDAEPGAVRKYHGVPPYRETKRYVARITALYRQMCGLTNAQQVSAR